MDNQDFHRKIKSDIMDTMEEKIKRNAKTGCKNKVSYKFLVW